jgi:hypothetical protein
MRHALTSPLRQRQTYRNLAYLALAFPLGIVEFTFLVTGLALGLGLLITWFGLAVLLATLGGAFVLTRLERRLAAGLLGAEIPAAAPAATAPPGIPGRLKAHLTRRTTWTSLGYLAAKLPLATASFVVAAAALALSVALLAAPITYGYDDAVVLLGWDVDTLPEALASAAAGIAALPLALHLVNALAALWARFSRALLPAPAIA